MEKLKVFDENYIYLKDADRDEVHQVGLWHETFHCWLVDDASVYIQKRSATKKDFPGLYDITAAGHILANETVMDGIREVEEELGIVVDLSRIHSKGVVRDRIKLPGFLDLEFANLFFYEATFAPTDFSLQREEVASVHVVKRQALIDLFLTEVTSVACTDIIDGMTQEVGLADFVPHERAYFQNVGLLLK